MGEPFVFFPLAQDFTGVLPTHKRRAGQNMRIFSLLMLASYIGVAVLAAGV